MKPTSLCVTHAAFSPLHRRCPGHHAHEILQGQVYSEFFGKVVYRTKLAQEYPHLLCAAMAEAISAVRVRPLQLMVSSFGLLSTGKRKRLLGKAMHWEGHRQHLNCSVGGGIRLSAQTWCNETFAGSGNLSLVRLSCGR